MLRETLVIIMKFITKTLDRIDATMFENIRDASLVVIANTAKELKQSLDLFYVHFCE